jgi:hypothetical protein
MATTVEDLYREVLGREPDPEGLANWKAAFGEDVSPEERASFMQAAAPELASKTPATPDALAERLSILEFVNSANNIGTIDNQFLAGGFGIDNRPTPMTPDQLQARAQKAYDDYSNVLRNGEVTADTIRQAYGEHDPAHVQRVLKIKSELDAQQAAGAKEYYSAGRISAENATWDMAFRLSEVGLSSVQDMGKRTDYDLLEREYTQYYNKANGEDITNNWNRVSDGGGLRTNYNLHFTDDGMVMPYTSRESSSWVNFRDSTLKPIGGIVLAAYGVPYVAGALAGTTIGGVTLAKGSAALAAASSAAVSGGVSLLAGNSFEDSLKSALVSGLTAGASAGYADKIGQSLGFDAGSIASKAAGNAVVAAVKAGVTDENVLESMVTAALTTAMTAQNDFDATEREGSLAKMGPDDYEMTTDFTTGTSLSLGSNLKFGGTGLKVDDVQNAGMNVGDGAVDYGIGNVTGGGGLGLTLPSSSNLNMMGGGQGITAKRDDGTTLSGADETGINLKDVKTIAKIGGVLMAGDELIDQTIRPDTSLGAKRKDPWRNAPIEGFRMAKYEDPATGKFKYVPFVKDNALLPPPSGYKEIDYYAKGGFVTKRN